MQVNKEAQELLAKVMTRLHNFIANPWETEMEPYQVVPNVYYVGNKYVGSYLLNTDKGLILIDAALQETDYLLFESIRKLGFSPKDIKKLLITHGHIDHCGAARAVQEYSGCEIWFPAGDAFFLTDRRDLLLGEVAEFKVTDYYNYDEQGNPTGQNGYYDLRNTYSGNYIAPQLDGGKIVSDNATGVNLDGRYYQEEYTKIKCWDDTYYSYMSLKVDLENNRVVPCPSAQADDFYFAKVKNSPIHLTEVDTVDNVEFGISMKMIDFNNTIVGGRDSKQTEYFGKDSDRINNPRVSRLQSNGFCRGALHFPRIREVRS